MNTDQNVNNLYWLFNWVKMGIIINLHHRIQRDSWATGWLLTAWLNGVNLHQVSDGDPFVYHLTVWTYFVTVWRTLNKLQRLESYFLCPNVTVCVSGVLKAHDLNQNTWVRLACGSLRGRYGAHEASHLVNAALRHAGNCIVPAWMHFRFSS